MGVKFTRERSNGRVKLIAHIPGGRDLTRDLPPGGVRWAVTFAVVSGDITLIAGDEEVLYVNAGAAGRPLTERETRALLLARRLGATV